MEQESAEDDRVVSIKALGKDPNAEPPAGIRATVLGERDERKIKITLLNVALEYLFETNADTQEKKNRLLTARTGATARGRRSTLPVFGRRNCAALQPRSPGLTACRARTRTSGPSSSASTQPPCRRPMRG